MRGGLCGVDRASPSRDAAAVTTLKVLLLLTRRLLTRRLTCGVFMGVPVTDEVRVIARSKGNGDAMMRMNLRGGGEEGEGERLSATHLS